MTRMIWIALLLVCSCGDSEGGGSSKSRRDREHDRGDKSDKSDKGDKDDRKLSCEDAVDGYTRDRDKKADLVRTCIRNEWSRRMKRCVLEAETRDDYRACEREHDERGANQKWDLMAGYADKVCACSDMDCITRASEAYAKQATEESRSADALRDMTEDDRRRSEAIMKKITECTKRLTEELMKQAGGDSTGW